MKLQKFVAIFKFNGDIMKSCAAAEYEMRLVVHANFLIQLRSPIHSFSFIEGAGFAALSMSQHFEDGKILTLLPNKPTGARETGVTGAAVAGRGTGSCK